MPKKEKTANEMSDKELAESIFGKQAKKKLDQIAHKDDDKAKTEPSKDSVS